jgi:uncharacterized membrane protein
MRTYAMVTGTIFGLIAVAHVVRVFAEGPRLLKDPVFVLLTILALALCFWGWWLVRLSSRRKEG